MKRVLLAVFSIILVLACVFSVTGLVSGVQDILAIKEYKLSDSDTANEGLATARDGLAQLKENEQTYLDGAVTYVNGLAELAAGQQKLAAGRQELAAGQKQIDDNTQAYLEGKELIGTLEGLMPTVEALAGALQNMRDFNAGLIGGEADQYLGQLRANAMNFLANTSAVRVLSDTLGMDVGSLLASNPEDTSVLGNVVNMYYDGLAQLKQYEDGLAQLEAGKKELAAGEAQLAAGQQQLADGNAQLLVYEDGEMQIADGMRQLMESMTPSYHQRSFEQTVPSLPELLAESDEFDAQVPALYNDNGFDEAAYGKLVDTLCEQIYALDEEGERVQVRGNDHVDLDKCVFICDTAQKYLDLSTVDTEGELYWRVGTYAAAAIAAILGLIAGIMGLVASITGGKTTGKTLGIISAVLAVGALIAGAAKGLSDFIYGIRVDDVTGAYATAMEGTHIEYCGDQQRTVLIVLAVAAVLFVIFAAIAKSAAKKKAAKKAAAAAASVSAVSAADEERIANLEKENAELKAMVAEMAADAATVKE